MNASENGGKAGVYHLRYLIILPVLLFFLLLFVRLFSFLPGDCFHTAPLTGSSPEAAGIPAALYLPSGPFLTPEHPLPVTEVCREERDLIVFLYENSYPEQAAGLLRFFSQASSETDKTCTEDRAEDIRNIKYLVYCSPEPWRSLFLENIGSLRLKNISGRSCYIGGWKKTVCTDLDEAGSDPRGPYVTFFHECAHGIDDCSCLTGRFSETDLSGTGGLSTRLVSDISSLLFKPDVRSAGLPDDDSPADASFSGGSGSGQTDENSVIFSCSSARTAFTAAEREILTDMLSAHPFLQAGNAAGAAGAGSSAAASDAAGGGKDPEQMKFSGYVHEPSCWKEPGMPENEFFAEYLSCLMTGAGDPSGLFPMSSAYLSDLTARLFRNKYTV